MRQYSSLRTCYVRGLSITSVVLCVFSCVIQSVILTCYSFESRINSTQSDLFIRFDFNFEYGFDDLDLIGCGIWAGVLYGIGGIIGLCASYQHKHSQLIATTVFTSFSVCAGTVCAGISGLIAVYNTVNDIQSSRLFWTSLEYSLMGVSIIAVVINLLSLVFTLRGLCGRANNNGLVRLSHLDQLRPYRQSDNSRSDAD